MRIKCHLTRRANGLYLLTHKPPVIARVGQTERRDAYAEPGDALGLNNVCEWAAWLVCGVENLEPLKTVRVWIEGGQKER